MPGQVPFRDLAVRQLIKDVAYPDIESSFLQNAEQRYEK
jgi:hypothetical protein